VTPIESALVILVPEADAWLGALRDRYDPSAAAAVPAHITLLVPFKPPHEIDAAVVGSLRECFVAFAPFSFSLGTARRFPGVLYLAPEPDEPFRQLTLAIWRRYPETPPYAGRHTDIVPHLCVAQNSDEQLLDQIAMDIEAKLEEASRQRRPIRSMATEVALMDNRSGRWQVRDVLKLGRA